MDRAEKSGTTWSNNQVVILWGFMKPSGSEVFLCCAQVTELDHKFSLHWPFYRVISYFRWKEFFFLFDNRVGVFRWIIQYILKDVRENMLLFATCIGTHLLPPLVEWNVRKQCLHTRMLIFLFHWKRKFVEKDAEQYPNWEAGCVKLLSSGENFKKIF